MYPFDPAIASIAAYKLSVKSVQFFRIQKLIPRFFANHGTIGVGKTLMAAQYLAKIIEETAYIAYVQDTLIAIIKSLRLYSLNLGQQLKQKKVKRNVCNQNDDPGGMKSLLCNASLSSSVVFITSFRLNNSLWRWMAS